jgi:hypothetical protein
MKKCLLILLCAFAAISANAWVVTFSDDGHTAFIEGSGNDGQNKNDLKDANGNDVSDRVLAADSLKFSGTINTLDPFQGGSFTNAKTVDFSKATFKETSKGFVSYTDINGNTQTVEKFQNCMSFKHFKNVTKAVLANVKTLNQDTFQNNVNIKTFTIPNTVTCIESDMITNSPITHITIPANVKYIETQAFMNAAIKELIDVYVLGETAAAKNAFDFQVTVGQTDADYAKYATLHFPEGKEDFFTNTHHKLTQEISLNKGKFQTWLNNHKEGKDDNGNELNVNGWQQFINAGSGKQEDVPETRVVLRTYSDKYARLVPMNFRAYVVTGVHEDTNGNYVLDLVQIFAIPANTGVILYGSVDKNSTGYTLGRITSWDKGGADYVAPYTRFTPAQTSDGDLSPKNYMVPTVENTIIYPYYKGMTDDNWKSIWDNAPTTMANYFNASGSVTDRSFIMTKLSSTSFASKVVADDVASVPDGKSHNYVGFFRTKPALVCGPNKAYLCLPNSVLSDPQSFEGVVVKPTGDEMTFRPDEWNKFVSTGNWGPRGLTDPLKSKVAGDVEEVSGISNVSAEAVEDGSYYTLQGVKVAQPNKGIYIKNGKKIIIK